MKHAALMMVAMAATLASCTLDDSPAVSELDAPGPGAEVTAATAPEPTDPPPAVVSSDGAIGGDPQDVRPVDARVLSEIVLANGNTITFFQHADGGMVVREHGTIDTNAIGTIPELANASPYEIFVAIAPAGTPPPAELVAEQVSVVAQRRQAGETSTMPEGFRVDAIPEFYSAIRARAFNSCTDVTAWKGHVGSSPIGANCPASGSFAYKQCVTGWTPPHLDTCAGTNCTAYFEAGYRKTRSSVCARAGTGYVQFAMGIRDHGGSYKKWFEHTLYTGGYYYYWYSHSTKKKDFWRLIYRSGTRKANKSWWLKS